MQLLHRGLLQLLHQANGSTNACRLSTLCTAVIGYARK